MNFRAVTAGAARFYRVLNIKGGGGGGLAPVGGADRGPGGGARPGKIH